MSEQKLSGIDRAVLFAGTQAALARLIGVPPQSVSHWIRRGHVASRHVMTVAAKTGIPAVDLTGLHRRKERSDKRKKGINSGNNDTPEQHQAGPVGGSPARIYRG